MRGLKVNFLQRDDEKVLIDVRKAMLAGAREIEVYYDEPTNNITVEVRKTRGERIK
jgi:hypothetical protein